MTEPGCGSLGSSEGGWRDARRVVGWEDGPDRCVGETLPGPRETVLARTARFRRRHRMEDPFREELFVSEVQLPSILARRRLPSGWGAIQEKSEESPRSLSLEFHGRPGDELLAEPACDNEFWRSALSPARLHREGGVAFSRARAAASGRGAEQHESRPRVWCGQCEGWNQGPRPGGGWYVEADHRQASHRRTRRGRGHRRIAE